MCIVTSRASGRRRRKNRITRQSTKKTLTPGLLEVQDVAVLLEHVNLLDTGDRGDAKLLESGLELDVAALLSGSRLLDDLASEGGLTALLDQHCVAADKTKTYQCG